MASISHQILSFYTKGNMPHSLGNYSSSLNLILSLKVHPINPLGLKQDCPKHFLNILVKFNNLLKEIDTSYNRHDNMDGSFVIRVRIVRTNC